MQGAECSHDGLPSAESLHLTRFVTWGHAKGDDDRVCRGGRLKQAIPLCLLRNFWDLGLFVIAVM
ncbi:hypothetical protein D8M36_01955 [Dermabacter sp. HSID17554]|nr:hypothetical protein D8M36_01955 [Dermabacter sp. HSID17554]